MVRIQQEVSLAEAMHRILEEYYAAVPPTDYRKQVRIQIKNVALQSEAFCNELEMELRQEVTDIPGLDEIEYVMNKMPRGIKEVFERYGVIEWAKKFSKTNKKIEGGAK